MPNIKRPAKLEHLEELIQFVSDCAEERGLTGKRLFQVQLALEEALVNIVNYAYPKETGEVEVRCGNDTEGSLVLTILDSGIPFDIRKLPAPDVTASVEEREIGGLGVFFMHKMADKISYRRDGEQNIVTITLRK